MPSSKSEIYSKLSYLLDVVVAQSAAILELLAGEDQALLVWGNALLVLDLGLDVVDGVARLDVEGNGLTRQGLDETISSRISPRSFLSFRLILVQVGGPSGQFAGGRHSKGSRVTYICTGNTRKKGHVSS
jgi:hypothetical protein